MKITKIIIVLILLLSVGCSEVSVTEKIIGKDIAGDRYGHQDHYIYTNSGQHRVSGSMYYKLKVGDNYTFTQVTIK